MALDAASFPILWDLYDKTGDLRPEYVLPVLYGESGFNPGAVNAGHYGLNQIDGASLTAMGIDPASYVNWAPSQQLNRVVEPSLVSLVENHGPIRSGTRLYQANFLPGSLGLAHDFGDVIVAKGGTRYGGQEDAFYRGNQVLDTAHKGFITVGDLAARVKAMSSSPTVAAAIAKAYLVKPPNIMLRRFALAPDLPHNPVDGEDYSSSGTYLPPSSSSGGGGGTPATSTSWLAAMATLGALGVAAAGGAWYLSKRGRRRRR